MGSGGAYGNVLVGVVHHGDEHVEQHHQRDDVVSAEHGGAHELRKLVVGVHVGHVQVDQTEDGPEQRLQRLKESAGDKNTKKQLLNTNTHTITHSNTHTHTH